MSRTVRVRVPGDKSITHRALLIGALADGISRVRAPLDAADTRSTRGALELLGVRVEDTPDGLLIHGRGPNAWSAPAAAIDCGNSGTTARLLMGALAGMPFPAELLGDASLQARPMARVMAPLTTMGARFEPMGEAGYLPVRMRGRSGLSSIEHHNAQSSAQVKSALLLAGLTGDTRVAVHEPRMSRDHTERMLAAAGVPLDRVIAGDEHRVSINGRHAVQPLDMDVPADFSSAAFFIALALLWADVKVVLPDVGLNPGRTGLLRVLRRMNAVVDVGSERMAAGEPVGDVHASPASLTGIDVDPADIPSLIDEIPVIAVLAARASGETRISGAGELRVKETDRITALVRNLRMLGVRVEEERTGMVIEGTQAPLRGRIETFGDHRIAMAFAVLGCAPGNDIQVDDPGVVDVSYPGFWQALEQVRAGATA